MDSRTNRDAVGAQRPFAKPLGFAEFQFGQFGGRALIGGMHLQLALADFDLTPVASEHVLHEADDEVRHAILPAAGQRFLPLARRSSAGLPTRSNAAIKEKTWRGNYGTGTEKEAALLTNASILMIRFWRG